jgi:recombination protein RecA
VRRAIMVKDKEKPQENSTRFCTGSDLLDLVVGGGQGMGFPSGKVINIVGDKSSGKTFIACEIVANAYHKYGKRLKWVYDDAESGFTFNTKEMYGVEIMPLNDDDRVKSRTVEDMYCNFKLFLKTLKDDEVGIYVVDSLDGLTSEENEKRGEERIKAFEQDKEFKQGSYQMGAAKFLSQEFFKGVTEETEQKNCLLIIISQVRENIEPFSFEKYVRSGGKALDFYAHTVVWLACINKIKKKERTVGVIVKAKTTKSKTPRPFRECVFSLLFDYGLDNIGSDVDYIFDLRGDSGVLLSKAESLAWSGESSGEGMEATSANLRAFLEDIERWADYKADIRTDNGGKMPSDPLKKSLLIKWIESHPEVQEVYEKKFGASMTREELIQYVESKGLTKELTQKVVDKWETVENSIRTNRPPKYQE